MTDMTVDIPLIPVFEELPPMHSKIRLKKTLQKKEKKTTV
jgi:hypothetical protein